MSDTNASGGESRKNVETMRWVGGTDGYLKMIDQTLLPVEFKEIDCRDAETVWEAIKMLRVRGAPAIGIAAAYGVCVGIQSALDAPENTFFARLDEVTTYLAGSRPTAVNLFWALERMKRKATSLRGEKFSDVTPPYLGRSPPTAVNLFWALKGMEGWATSLREKKSSSEIGEALLEEAKAIHEEDRHMCRAIGRHGAELLADGMGVLTHCNAGGLATADYGTALAVFFAAAESGKTLHVYADETRPLLQGARLTTWELQQRGIDVTLICDSMAAQVMREGRIQAVVTGADRIAGNGDAANKIGTYGVAQLAAAHEIPFYVAAPSSTFDLSLAGGDQIPIEERDPREITHGFGRQTAPDGVKVYNPAFDVTPARLIEALICEKGIIKPVTTQRIAEVLGQ